MSTVLPQIVYVVGAFLAAFLIAAKSPTRHRLIAGLVSFWILGASIINQETFVIPMPDLAGDLQAGRLIFIVLAVYLVASAILGRNRREVSERPRYERYLYAYFICMFVVLGYHLFGGTLTAREFVKVADGLLRVLVTYLVLKQVADEEMIKVIFRSLLIVAGVSAIVATVQSFYNPYVLRVGDERVAFGDTIRPNGVFSSEYLHSYFCVLALIITLVTIESRKLKVVLVMLYLTGILLSLHRMSWIVTFAVLAVYALYGKRKQLARMAVTLAVAALSIYVVSTELTPLFEKFQASALFKSRLGSDTMSTRTKLFSMVLHHFDDIALWGAGSRQTDIYYYGMLETGVVDRQWALGRAGSIHDLYLEILFLYGLTTLVIFSAMLLSMLRSFRSMVRTSAPFFLVPLLFTVMFMLMNLTNAFPLQGPLGFLFAIILGVSGSVPARQFLQAREPRPL